jgi:hypothetical protein
MLSSKEELNLESVIQEKEASDTLGASMTQLEQYLKGVAQGQEKFQEAVTILRQAIQFHQYDFDYKIRIKEYLARMLQDAGTAATYAGNLAKAIEIARRRCHIMSRDSRLYT